jgi:hypothetical protein
LNAVKKILAARGVRDLRNLFERAGFDLACVIDTSSSMQIIEARPT